MIGQIIFIILLLVVITYMIYALRRGNIILNSVSGSIPVEYEILEINKIPLITLTSKHGNKYIFLVDTGACANYINSQILHEFDSTERTIISDDSFYGIDGEVNKATVHNLMFTHRNSKLNDYYLASDMSKVFDKIRESINRDIHGIIGIPFLKKHGLSLDVNRMMVWKRL